MKTIALVALLALSALALQEEMPQPAVVEQHEWLAQLVGEWTGTSEATMEPGTEPMKMAFEESVRSVGRLWILAEGSATFGGSPFTSIMTLGYDPRQEAFVGTWIDSTQTHLWTYRGTLDEAGTVLTLETEGPSYEDPTKTKRYRDVIGIDGPDRRTLTSSSLGEDGSWTTLMRAEYRRQP